MRRLDALIKGNSELQRLTAQAGQITQLQTIWQGVVPAALRAHTQACGLQHRRITVTADNGAIASKLKLLSPSLLKSLQIKGLEVTSIRVEVQVKSTPKVVSRQPRHLSSRAASNLTRLAEGLPDSPLRTALLRLSSRG